MPASVSFSVAQLTFSDPESVNLAFVVSALQGLFQDLPLSRTKTTWDQDDIIAMSLGALRIVLCSGEAMRGADRTILTLAIGPCPDADVDSGSPDQRLDRSSDQFRKIGQWLVHQLSHRLSPVTTIWKDFEGPLTHDAATQAAQDMQLDEMQSCEPTDMAKPSRYRPVTDDEVSACLRRMPAPRSNAASPPVGHRSARPLLRRAMAGFTRQSDLRQVAALLIAMPLCGGLLAHSLVPRADGSALALYEQVQAAPIGSGHWANNFSKKSNTGL